MLRRSYALGGGNPGKLRDWHSSRLEVIMSVQRSAIGVRCDKLGRHSLHCPDDVYRIQTEERMKPGVYYIVDLIHAGMDGAVTAEKTTIVPQTLIGSVLTATAIGAGAGAGVALLNEKRSKYEVAIKSLIGGVVGLGCGLAWASRGYTGSIARGAKRKIDVVRDAHWLEKHPIDYA